MKVIKAEIVRGKEPILLPQPWLAAWCEPDGKPVTSFEFACYRLYTRILADDVPNLLRA